MQIHPMMLGMSHCHDVDIIYPWERPDPERQISRAIRDLHEAGASWWRPHLHWNRIEPEVRTVIGHRSDVTDSLVRQYSETAQWRVYDLMLEHLAGAGIRVVAVLGCGFTVQLPWAILGDRRVRLLPGTIGRESYLAHLYLHTRAVVRRYHDRVSLWQMENEMNVAGETLLFRWRHGMSWASPSFKNQVMETIHKAVKEEAPQARTTHNFHTDFRIIPGVYSWRRDIKKWAYMLNVIGIDTYPNYLFGRPLLGRLVGAKLRLALRMGLGKPVILAETGYPTRPRWRLFNEEGQARYIAQTFEAVRAAGAEGYFYFCLSSTEDAVGDPRWEGKRAYLQRVENFWGLIRRGSARKSGFSAFQSLGKHAG